ncbi:MULTISPECIES: adenosylcobinamide amidohydrolase [unclassified Paenibacillus]|uniref:adenosylcobinamide amidohydrolase n=1 Tax=unclassified Paenibacillus TaxID=185978 RepID=UPI0009A7256F|nr:MULTISPECIES: adenosylcobinamide amidohydrolase [unclassified Paenibacillus]SLK04209.1 Adenosylcobinamide amidohydrolase [Paenibacillus sp. RU5A]SOC69588.1 Adenosylcobinamide amidohydrolase [Paenibacillus sp. RU26A]SOC72025.1 Adenosylcobinamide amidohydrolase [Paenibacillus sp. RU5M]
MALPFYNYYSHVLKDQNEYRSSVWPGLFVSAHERHIKASSPSVVTALSSAVYGGGMIELDRIFNIYVDKHYRCDDPPRDIADLLSEWQEQQDQCAGLLTAVRLEHTAIQEYESDEFGLLCCTTAGVSNAARAGSARTVFDAAGNEMSNGTVSQKIGKVSASTYTPGTINIMLWMNGRMTAGAMVNAIQTAVEAKAAALADFGVADSENGLTATGTTTDAIVLAVSQAEVNKPLISYAGTATVMGAAIGRLVYDTIMESLKAAQEWKERNNKQ